jgi:hypothetical protein
MISANFVGLENNLPILCKTFDKAFYWKTRVIDVVLVTLKWLFSFLEWLHWVTGTMISPQHRIMTPFLHAPTFDEDESTSYALKVYLYWFAVVRLDCVIHPWRKPPMCLSIFFFPENDVQAAHRSETKTSCESLAFFKWHFKTFSQLSRNTSVT